MTGSNIKSIKKLVLIVLGTTFLTALYYLANNADKKLAEIEVLLKLSALPETTLQKVETTSFVSAGVMATYKRNEKARSEVYNYYCSYLLAKNGWYEAAQYPNNVVDLPSQDCELISDKLNQAVIFCDGDSTMFVLYFDEGAPEKKFKSDFFRVHIGCSVDGNVAGACRIE